MKRFVRRLTHREFLKTCGLVLTAAGAAQLASQPQSVAALTPLNDDYQVNGNLFVMPGVSPAGPGRVGVGLTTPGYQLHLYANGSQTAGMVENQVATGAVFHYWRKPLASGSGTLRWGLGVYANSDDLRLWNGSADVFTVRASDGSVGIGASGIINPNGFTAPVLNVRAGTASQGSAIYVGNAANDQGLMLAQWGTVAYVLNTANGGLQFGNYLARVVITSSGNVGIGTALPTAKLELKDGDLQVTNGTIKVGSQIVANTGGCVYA